MVDSRMGSICYKSGIYHLSKIHNMLKYLLENTSTSHTLDASSKVITWPSVDLQDYDYDFMNEQTFQKQKMKMTWYLFLDDDMEEYSIKSKKAQVINDHIRGKMLSTHATTYQDFDNLRFYVLIIDKVSNGRISSKIFPGNFYGRFDKSHQ